MTAHLSVVERHRPFNATLTGWSHSSGLMRFGLPVRAHSLLCVPDIQAGNGMDLPSWQRMPIAFNINDAWFCFFLFYMKYLLWAINFFTHVSLLNKNPSKNNNEIIKLSWTAVIIWISSCRNENSSMHCCVEHVTFDLVVTSLCRDSDYIFMNNICVIITKHSGVRNSSCSQWWYPSGLCWMYGERHTYRARYLI